MSGLSTTEPRLAWEDIVLSFAPPAKRTGRARARLSAYRLPLILIVQAALTWRLNDIIFDDEALYLQGGHVVTEHLLHGGTANAGELSSFGNYFSGAPNLYPVVGAALDSLGGLVLARLFSLLCALVASVCVYRIGRHLFSENVGLLASLVFALAGSVQFVGKLATYDAPCLVLIAVAAYIAITKKSMVSAAIVGTLLVTATATKYAGLAMVPFVLAMTFLAALSSDGLGWRRNLPRAVARGGIATLVFAGLLLIGYHLWGSGIAVGVKATTTGRKALDPAPLSVLLKSLFFDIGLTWALAVGGIVLLLRRRAWDKVLLMVVMLGAGSVIQASSVRIHELTSLDKHTYFSGFFCAVPAALALDWALSKRGRMTLMAIAVIWLLLIDGMWRSKIQYSWPSSIMAPIKEINTLELPGRYFSFDSDTGAYYTQGDPQIQWYSSAAAYALFSGGDAPVIAMEQSHEFTGFLFQTTNLNASNLAELHLLDRYLAADPYYNRTSTFRVSPYSKGVWELWIHYPPGRHHKV
jgi:4-amino-4-deoxy-L-arabinose transferase-like glycosyltransferase